FDHLGGRSVSQTNLDSSWLRLTVLAQHPHSSYLTFEYRRRGRCKAILAIVVPGSVITVLSLASLAVGAASTGTDTLAVRVLRSEPECRVWHLENVVALINGDDQIRSHAGFQSLLWIVDVDHYFIGDDVLYVLWIQTHLFDLSVEILARERVDGELDRLSLFHQTNVCLVDVCDDLHLGQVVRDGEKSWRRQTSGHRL